VLSISVVLKAAMSLTTGFLKQEGISGGRNGSTPPIHSELSQMHLLPSMGFLRSGFIQVLLWAISQGFKMAFQRIVAQY
jgi:hypothetical protein